MRTYAPANHISKDFSQGRHSVVRIGKTENVQTEEANVLLPYDDGLIFS